MVRKRNPLNEPTNMTFGIGVPIDIFGNAPHQDPENRALPSQFSIMTLPMNCNFIRNPDTFYDEKPLV